MNHEYAAGVTRQAVGRACIALGLKSTSKATLDSLADVVVSYIEKIAESALERAEQGGRTVAGIQDVLPVVEQTRPFYFSWKEMRDFAFDDVKKPNVVSSAKWNQPFPYEIPVFPLVSRVTTAKDDRLLKEPSIKDPFVPNHLPAYPPSHTYKRLQQLSKKRSVGDESNIDGSTSSSAGRTKRKRISNLKSTQHSLSLIEDSVDSDKVVL